MNSQTLKILEENNIQDKPWDYEDNLPKELREIIIDIEANYRLYPTTYGIIDYLTSNYKQENYDKTYCSKILNLIEIPENVQTHLFPILETEKTYHETKHKIKDELQQVKLAPLPEQIQSLDQAITESITIEEAIHDYKQAVHDYIQQKRKLEKFLHNDNDVIEAQLMLLLGANKVEANKFQIVLYYDHMIDQDIMNQIVELGYNYDLHAKEKDYLRVCIFIGEYGDD